MTERVYNLQYFLREKEYVAAVRAALESKVKFGLFKKDKEVIALLHSFNEGKTTRDQAEHILAHVVVCAQKELQHVTPQTLGAASVLRGAMLRLGETVQLLQKAEKRWPDAPQEEISIKVMTGKVED